MKRGDQDLRSMTLYLGALAALLLAGHLLTQFENLTENPIYVIFVAMSVIYLFLYVVIQLNESDSPSKKK